MTQEMVAVAAGVLLQGDGFLMASRPSDKVYGGYWEFPGGKLEAGESPVAALTRELGEELGIRVLRADPWIVREHTYPHARVRLHFFRVREWLGKPKPHEGQNLRWLVAGAPVPEPMLPANAPVLRALSLPAVYGITQAEAEGVEIFLTRLDQALARGLRLIQVRDKRLPEPDRMALARAVVARAHAYGARVLVNGSVEMCRQAGADGVHLDSASLARLADRPDVDWLAASCHSLEELQSAAAFGVDFAVLSPVLPTATHPGAAALGWQTFADWARRCPMPVYALGGMDGTTLDDAWRHGAHGIAMLRGAWK